MIEEKDGQMSLLDPATSFGKMSREYSAQIKGATSRPSSRKSPKSSTLIAPMCLCLKTENGAKQDASMMIWEDSQLLGGYTMRSFGVSPREENASHLSQILEDTAPPKYSLSAKACTGILNRAEKRGKILPEMLKAALEAQSLSKNEPESLEAEKES